MTKIEKKSILYLSASRKFYTLINCIAFEGVAYDGCYRGFSSIVMYYIISMWYALKLPFARILFNPKIKDYSGVIIASDSMFFCGLYKYIRKKNPNARLIQYYQNKVRHPHYIKLAREYGWDVWTFNPTDAKKYGIKINPAFGSKKYFDQFKTKEPTEYDIVFIGRCKGRMDYIRNLASEPTVSGLRWYLYFVTHPFYKRYLSREDRKIYKKPLPYEKTLEIVAKSTSVLEVQDTGADGVILRNIEAMFMEKKTISTNARLKEMDFYHPDNIFIIGDDDISKLPQFIKTPYHPIDEEILSRYTVDAWINRFLD